MQSKFKPVQTLQNVGQSLWLDNITRDMLDDGTLERYRDQLGITGLTSNPTIFAEAIAAGSAYDEQINLLSAKGVKTEQLFAELAISDLQRAADLFRPIFDQTRALDGWVSMEVSPLLLHDAEATVLAAKEIHLAAARPNLFVKIPGSPEGVSAIEESLFAGIPVNVTLLFSSQQYLAVAEAYMRAMERRIAAGLSPNVASVASLFVSRWDKAVEGQFPVHLRNKLGIAVAQSTYKAYWDLVNSRRWRMLESKGARPQRLLWASTGTKDPQASPDLYASALAAPNTVNTMPEKTLLYFVERGVLGTALLSEKQPDSTLSEFKGAGLDVDALASRLQDEGGASFVKSWKTLLDNIHHKQEELVA